MELRSKRLEVRIKPEKEKVRHETLNDGTQS